MATKWHDIPLQTKMFQNIKEAVLTQAHATIENAYINESGGHSRFPGLKSFTTLSGNSPVYLDEWRGDLIAVSGSRIYRVSKDGTVDDVTGVPISGGKRAIFDKTEDEILIAAGGQIIHFAGEETKVLSEDAPESTHVGFIDGYVVAIEKDSGRFYHSTAGNYSQWDALDVFSADGKPDNLNALLITPYREMLLCGDKSIEQFERLPNGDTPFFRRWAVGEGVIAPYTIIAADNGTWAINQLYEFVRFSGQASEPNSDDIGHTLEDADDWTDAWASIMHVYGQKFIILQLPYATNAYETKGITAVLDYRQKRWSSLYGWDNTVNQPTRWPGWSHYPMWGRHFVGGNGKIYELDHNVYSNDGQVQRMLARSAHIDGWGEVRMDNLRIRVKRGVVGSNDDEPVISIRVRRDNKNWTNWKRKGLGKAGEREMVVEFGGFGCGHTFQIEYMVTDACEVEVVKMAVQLTALGE